MVVSSFGTWLEERYGLTWLFWLRGPVPTPNHVVVVSVDRRSAEAFGISPDEPWPRTLHACLVEALSRQGVSVIAFDVFFRAERASTDIARRHSLQMANCADTLKAIEQHRNVNAAFAHAIARAGNVVLLQEILEERLDATGGLVVIRRPELPHPDLASAARTVAPFTLPIANMRVTRFHVARSVAGKDLYSMPAIAAQHHVDWHKRRGNQSLPALAIDKYRNRINLINFYGRSGAICTISFTKALHGEWERGSQGCRGMTSLNGKAVFVGAGWSRITSTDSQDDFDTVYSQGPARRILGVEVMATIFQNLVEDSQIRAAHPVAFALPCAFLSVLFLSPFALLQGIKAILAVIIIGALYLVASQLVFTYANLWLPVAIPLGILLPLSVFTGLLLQYRRSKRALDKYLPTWVASRSAISDAQSESAEEVQGTCLCTDVENYATLSERITPAKLAELTNLYFSAVGGCVARHGGEILDIVGDGMTALWHDRSSDRESRLQTCLAALDICGAVDAFNQVNPGLEFPTRLGINSGPIALGDFGGAGRFSYSVVGDTVNTASRIEGLNRLLRTRLLAAAATVNGLDELLVRAIGQFRFKGKTEPYTIYQILSSMHMATPDQLRLCAQFSEACAALNAGELTRALRLFDELLALFPDDGPSQFYQARCRSAMAGSDKPYDPIISLQAK